MQITVGLNPETLNALNALTAAIAGISGPSNNIEASAVVKAEKAEKPAPAAKAPAKPAAKKAKVEETEAEEEADEAETIYWFSSATDTVGIVESEAEFKALKKKDPKTVKFTEGKYKEKLAEIEAAAAEEADAGEEDETEIPTVEDIVAVFGAYLPVDLEPEEQEERRPFVRAILTRFGAKKATALAEEHRRLAINLVERKMAGEDVDPENDEYQAVDEDGLV